MTQMPTTYPFQLPAHKLQSLTLLILTTFRYRSHTHTLRQLTPLNLLEPTSHQTRIAPQGPWSILQRPDRFLRLVRSRCAVLQVVTVPLP